MGEDQPLNNLNEHPPEIVKFDYIKSNLFRVIHAEGIWGCVTPSLNIQIAFWNERFPIPNQVVYRTLPNEKLEEIRERRDIRDSLIREVEASIVIDVETAEMLIDWLKERVEEIREIQVKQSNWEAKNE